MKSALFAVGVLALVGSLEAAEKPNVVLILADDLGAHDLGFMGADVHQTPNLDRLSKESVVFAKAYASHPSCSPMRAALLSGKYPARLGIVSHGAPREVTDGGGVFLMGEEYTLAEALRDGGYTTGHIGKWHIGMDGGTGPKDQGFEVDIASNDFCCPGRYFYPFKNVAKGMPAEKAEKAAVPDLDDRKPGDHLTDALGDEAAKFIAAHKSEPFFLNLWFYAVHTPLEAKKETVEKYKKLITPESKHRNAVYAGLVEHLDDNVGKVLKALDDNGLTDNTIVIFLGDNGGEVRNGVTSNFPLREGKVSLYEGGTRIPMMIKWPASGKAGGVNHEPVISHDVYRTVLGMTGVKGDPKHNAEMDGLDLTALLKDPSKTLERDTFNWLGFPLVVHYRTGDRIFGPAGSVVKGDWKLMEFFETPHGLEKEFELYNLKDDPSESKNLVKEMPEKVEELKAEMLKWRKEMNAPEYREMAYDVYKNLKNPLPVKK